MERTDAPRLPRDRLALYTLGALEAAVPLVAQVQWLDAHGVGQAQQLRVFALGYACFSLRPVYGALADALATGPEAYCVCTMQVAAGFLAEVVVV